MTTTIIASVTPRDQCTYQATKNAANKRATDSIANSIASDCLKVFIPFILCLIPSKYQSFAFATASASTLTIASEKRPTSLSAASHACNKSGADASS